MADVRVCMFCREERKLTSAHILSRKLQQLLPKVPPTVSFTTQDMWKHTVDDHGHRNRTLNSNPMDVQVKRLCAECNNVWMNEIEEKTRDLVAEMILGRRVALTVKDQNNVACWVAIIVMLRASQVPGRSFFTTNDYSEVRNRSLQPSGSKVWLVRTAPIWGNRSRHLRVSVSDGSEGHVSLYWFGELLMLHASYPLVARLEPRLRKHKGAVLQIYPPRRPRVVWPPPGLIGDELIMGITSLDAVRNARWNPSEGSGHG